MHSEPMPSVIHLNGVITSLMVLNFHRYVMGEEIPFTPIRFDAKHNKMCSENPIEIPDCLSCSYVADPDKANIETRYDLNK